MACSKYIHWIITLTLFISGVVQSLFAQKKEAPKLIYEDYASAIDFAVFSPNGKYILSGARTFDEQAKCKMHVWDVETGKMIKSFGDGYVLNAEFTPDGKFILSHGQPMKLINFETGKDVWTRVGSSPSAISADGKFIVGEYKSTFTLIEAETGKTITTFGGIEGVRIQSVAVSPGGRFVAASYRDDKERTVRLWDAQNGTLIRTLKGHLKEVTSVVFGPDGKYVLSGSEDNTIKLWDIESGQDMKTYKGGGLNRVSKKMRMDPKPLQPIAIEFSANGKQIIADYIYYSAILDVETGQVIITSGIPAVDEISTKGKAARFSPNGKSFLEIHKKSIKLFDVETAKELTTLVTFDNDIDWLVTSSDGRFDGSKGAMEQIYYEVDNDFLPLASFYERYYTPNLFSRKVDGEKFLERGSINNLKPPPTLMMNTSINGGLLSHQKRIEVSITTTNQGGGIDEIRLYQNAKLIKSKKIVGEDKNMIANVTLISEYDGENYFKAVAFSKDRTESKPAKLKVTYAGSKDARAHLYLLAIGINDYKNPKYKLNYAQADAKAFVEELNKSGDNLFVEKHLTFIENDKATKSTVLKAFEKIQSQILEQDVFIFYYAGHGILSEGYMGDKDYYLIMHDIVNMFGDSETLANKAVSTTELKELSQNLNAQKQIFFMDACQSGGAIELLAQRGVVDEKAIAQLARSTGTFWLAASGSEQFATEFETLGHGVFTYSILQGLTGQADVGKDGIVTVKELSMFLEREVPDLSVKFKGKQQYPISYGFGQDFPLIINNN